MSEGKYCSDDGDRGILPDPGMTATPTGMRAKDADEMALAKMADDNGIVSVGGLVSRVEDTEKMAIENVVSELLSVAAEMARCDGMPSEWYDDSEWWGGGVQDLHRMAVKANDQAKDWAVKVSGLARLLNPKEKFPLGVPTRDLTKSLLIQSWPSDRDLTKALVIQMREYIFHHQIPIGECVAWNRLKEMYGVGVNRKADLAWLKNYQQQEGS